MVTREEVKSVILESINHLGIKEIPSDTDKLYDIGIDSLDCIDIIDDIELAYMVVIDDNEGLEKACSGTIEELTIFLTDSVNKLRKENEEHNNTNNV